MPDFSLTVIVIALLATWCFVGPIVLLVIYRQILHSLWQEPVFRYPVLVIESDDWGAGPVQAQTAALNNLINLLTKYKDSAGRHPVVTLALVLAVPDSAAIQREGRYGRLMLDAVMFKPVVEAIKRGRAAGIFSLQLHGLEHYWPDTLMGITDAAVQVWLREEMPPATEELPSALQSRWVDASSLPSRPHSPQVIEAAVAEEAGLFERILGQRALVVVPPTFVWTHEVEQAWARHGVKVVITPGRRYTCRDEAGRPGCVEGAFLNGMIGAGVSYMVRDDYFEPERGHYAEQALAALAQKWSQGRPCLLETHRANFIGDRAVAERSFAEMDRLYALALARFPNLRFASCEELAIALQKGDAAWIDTRWAMRFSAWVSRVRTQPRFWKLARFTGLAWLMQGTAWAGRIMTG